MCSKYTIYAFYKQSHKYVIYLINHTGMQHILHATYMSFYMHFAYTHKCMLHIPHILMSTHTIYYNISTLYALTYIYYV